MIHAPSVAQALLFQAGGRALALDAGLVLGIEQPAHQARLPGAPEFVRGVIEMRDQAVVVLDLAVRLGLSPVSPPGPLRPVILVEASQPVAWEVERVEGLAPLSLEALLPAPGGLKTGVQGVLPDGRLLLDPEAISDGRVLEALPAGGGGPGE